jgi:hypothetical protein
MTKIPEERLGRWAVSAEATDTPEGRRFSVTFSMPAKLAIKVLDKLADDVAEVPGARRSALGLLPHEVAEHMDLSAWMELVSREFEDTSVGRPEADYGGLMVVYTEWLAAKSPKHGDREFTRRHMGAEKEPEIRAALEELRRARKWATKQGIDPAQVVRKLK